jgi:hypothetical protein
LDSIENPPDIPCLDEVKKWEFIFPEAYSELGNVKSKLECPTLNDLFDETFKKNILALALKNLK